MHKSTWKKFEARVGRYLGCDGRVGNTGLATPDAQNEFYCIECKLWSSEPTQVVNALRQAERAAQDGQLPLAVIGRKNHATSSALVVLRLQDFADHFGEAIT